MRLEVKEGKNNCLLINDSYNSDFGSLDIALDFLYRRSQSKGCLLSTSCVAKSMLSAREIAWSRKDMERPLYISKVEKRDDCTVISYGNGCYSRTGRHN